MNEHFFKGTVSFAVGFIGDHFYVFVTIHGKVLKFQNMNKV